jgi:hypothetical protein
VLANRSIWSIFFWIRQDLHAVPVGKKKKSKFCYSFRASSFLLRETTSSQTLLVKKVMHVKVTLLAGTGQDVGLSFTHAACVSSRCFGV